MSLVRDSRSEGSSSTVGFLGLPLEARENIYERVLVLNHPVYLFQDYGRRVETFAPDKPRHWLALLRTNRQIHRESKAVFYGKTYFFLMDRPQQQGALLLSFLNCIGSPNASTISRLCISFPLVEAEAGGVRMGEDSLRGLELLRDKCTNLITLEMQVCRENSRFLRGADKQLVREALMRIDAQVKAIPSVQRIAVRLHVKDMPLLAINIMQGFDWVISNR